AGDDAEARRRLHLVELAQAQHLRRLDPHLLLRLAEGGAPGVLADLAGAAGKGDLAAVAGEGLGALGEDRPQLARVDVEGHEDGGLPEIAAPARWEAAGRRRAEALADGQDPALRGGHRGPPEPPPRCGATTSGGGPVSARPPGRWGRIMICEGPRLA